MFTLYFDGHVEEWPEQLPENVVVWQTVNDATGQSNYFARWSEKVFIEVTKIMFDTLMQHLALQYTNVVDVTNTSQT